MNMGIARQKGVVPGLPKASWGVTVKVNPYLGNMDKNKNHRAAVGGQSCRYQSI